MPSPDDRSPAATVPRDLTAGLVVFLVALPLCLGVALASRAAGVPDDKNVPLLAGVVAGIVGGLLVGALSGSHTSVSGPAAGLTAVVAAQILALGSFQAFLVAVVLAGALQVVVGVCRGGFLAAFVPSAVIKGLLAAIGVILILKQIPHVVGHDPDPEGDFSFLQPDLRNTFSELTELTDDFHYGAAAIGLLSVAFLVVWDRVKVLKTFPVPAPLLVVLIGVGLAEWFKAVGGVWDVGTVRGTVRETHLVEVPVADSLAGLWGLLARPDWSQLTRPAVYTAAVTIAAVASLETLLNLEAVDKLDPRQRNSPPSRELVAQGVGNVVSGLCGGLPVTSVIVRSSVNINAGARTKLSTGAHGALLLVCVAFLAAWLNRIPLASLAAILLVTGVKLASPALVKDMWRGGRNQFLPFIITVLAIVFTDLLVGVLIGLGVSVAFILRSNLRRPLHRVVEKHLGGEVVHVELANQVSFLNKAALAAALDAVPAGGHVLLDATHTDYIDPDILDMIREFKETTGPARGVEVSLKGFRSKYHLDDQIQYVDYSTRDVQESMTPADVLRTLTEGNERFRTGRRLTRDLGRVVTATAAGQHPLAVVLSCIDSRSPAELLFDLTLGDIFVIRVAGNVTSRKILGSAEYGCAVAGAKLILVLGHTRCGAVTAAVDLAHAGKTAAAATGCDHIDDVVDDIKRCVDLSAPPPTAPEEKSAYVDAVARRNVLRSVAEIREQSKVLDRLAAEGRIAVVGAMYDVATGAVEVLTE